MYLPSPLLRHMQKKILKTRRRDSSNSKFGNAVAADHKVLCEKERVTVATSVRGVQAPRKQKGNLK